MKKFISILLVFALLLTGTPNICAAPLKDNAPPAVTSSTPNGNQNNVALEVALNIRFNEFIAKGSTFEKITLRNGTKTIPLNLSIKDSSISAIPTSKLAWTTEYTLTVPSGAIKDRAGNALAKPYAIKFKTLSAPVPLSEEIKQVFVGISKISVPYPGPLALSGKDWLPLAAVQFEPVHNVFAAARKYGNGRVLALGKEDILHNDNIYTLDNLKFLKNVFTWLNNNRSKRVGYSTGHGEFVNENTITSLQKELAKDKFSFNSTALTTDALKYKEILIIGNAWKSLSAAEITAVDNFVTNGGSLILAGLGWSYASYNPNSIYPMDTLSSRYGVKWANAVISDTLEKYKDAPAFDLTLRNVKIINQPLQDAKVVDKTLQDAMDFIQKITYEHSNDLVDVLESNEDLKTEYVKAHLVIASKVISTAKNSDTRELIYDFCKSMINLYPQYFSKKSTFDIRKYPTITWLRERFINTWISTLDLTPQRKAEIAALCSIEGQYLDIWNTSTIYIADNNGLDELQKKFLINIFCLLPDGLHNIRIIAVENFLQADLKDLPYLAFAVNGANYLTNLMTKGQFLTVTTMQGINSSINITDLKVTASQENSFPDRINPRIASIFCASTAHEINHIIDFYTVQNNALLARRQQELIKSAGENSANYLRSMFETGFFVNYPHEFLASIANSWFTDSANTVSLGLNDFNNGSKQPINQALFFAEVYSEGGSSTYFYNSDVNGNITRTTVPLTRDERGRINSLTFDGYRYDFILDTAGDVTSFTATKI